MATAFSAVRSGIVMFIIPFVFSFYPELLLIEAAVLDPDATSSGSRYLEGYDGSTHWISLGLLIVKLLFALYLLATALAAFDRNALNPLEIFLRLALALLILTKFPVVYIPAAVAALALITFHYSKHRLTTNAKQVT